MLGIVILNVVLAAFVIIGTLGLLGWSIVSNHAMARGPSHRSHRRARTPRPYARRRGPALPARTSQLSA